MISLSLTPCHVAPPLSPDHGFTHAGAYTDGTLMRPVAGSQFPSKPPSVVSAAAPRVTEPPPTGPLDAGAAVDDVSPAVGALPAVAAAFDPVVTACLLPGGVTWISSL